MDYLNLGRSGLKVSRLCLGCMSFGDPGRSGWALDEAHSRPLIARALEAGINFFDTANVYSLGASEEVLGRALRDMARREEVVVASKVCAPMRADPNGQGLSRKAIFHEIDATLQRLGMDHVDLYQVHRFDPDTPLEETLEALHDVVKAGKARYLGASSMHAWQFMKALGLQRAKGWAPFVSMQNQYNLLYREEEREMMPLCVSEGVAVLPWSPLARGRLTRPLREVRGSLRDQLDGNAHLLYAQTTALDRPIIEAVAALAVLRGVPPAQLALAWVLHQCCVTAPIVGATQLQHLEDALQAQSLTLNEDELHTLEDLYQPREVVGFS